MASNNKLNLVFTKNTRDDIRKLDRQVASRIRKKLVGLATSKQPLNTAVKLTKPSDALYRWRLGNYRILFDFNTENNTATVLKVQHRRHIYQ